MFTQSSLLFHALAATAGASFGMVALWAALSQHHWLLRFGVVAGLIGCLIPVPALDVAIVFVAQALVVIGPLVLKRRLDDSTRGGPALQTPAHDWRRFTVRDLFGLTLLIAAVCCVVAYSPAKVRDSSWRLALLGAGFGVATSARVWVEMARKKRIWPQRLALWLVAPLAGVPTAIDTSVGYFRYPAWLWCAVTAGVGILVALWLSLFRSVANLPVAIAERNSSSDMAATRVASGYRRALASVGLVILTMLVMWLPSVGYYDMLHTPTPVPFPPTPEPNAYDDLLRIEEKLRALGPAAVFERPPNGAAVALLKEAHTAINRPGAVSRCDEKSAISDINKLHSLASDLEFAVVAGHNTGLTDYEIYHDLLKLALTSSRGGVSIHRWQAAIIGRMGLDGFLRLRHRDRSGVAGDEWAVRRGQTMLADLVAYDAGWEPPSYARSREDRSVGWVSRISFLYAPWVKVWEGVRCWHSAEVRCLICRLAIARFRADKGRLPEQLIELVPKYLAELPEDPYSGRPLVYCLDDDNYTLHSVVGDNGRDEGSRRGPSDLDYDEPFLDEDSEAEVEER